MIVTDEGFELVRRQLALLEDGLVALCREMLPQESRNYWFFAQRIVEMIRKLRAEIDLYLGLDSFLDDAELADVDEASAAAS